MKKKISILGSTGSIGISTLKVIDKKKNKFKIILLSSNKNYSLICKQIKMYKPKYFLIYDLNTFEKVKKKFKKNRVILINSLDINLNKIKSDIFVSAISGIKGLDPTLKIIQFTKKILIANKESVICGWKLIKEKAKKFNTEIVPIDSEHFSILQIIKNHKIKEIKKVFLTASGGPFLNLKISRFKHITIKDALAHPKWKMGKKITIDSATLMNKIIELIEAHKIFEIPIHKLGIIIHPNSLVHAIVMFKNGLTKIIYHETSMIIPIANALFNNNLDIDRFLGKQQIIKSKKSLNSIDTLIFKKPDSKRFPSLKIIKELNKYHSTPIIINSVNEVLVEHFLLKKTSFLNIFKVLKSVMKDRNYQKYAVKRASKLSDIYKIDAWAKKITLEKIYKK